MIEFFKNLTYVEASLLIISIFFVGRVLAREVVVMMFYMKIRKERKKVQEELIKNKCEGPHNWMNLEINGETTHVCQDCNWSPTHEGFVKKEYVKAHLHEIKYREEMEQYKADKLAEIAKEFDLGIEAANKLYDKMIVIKKDFGVQYLDKKIKELLSEGE